MAEREGRPPAWSWKWGPPRLFTRAQVRRYLQIADAELAHRMARGQIPGPLWGCDAELASARWDRHAIDRALDRASGIMDSLQAEGEAMDRALGISTGRRR